MATMTQVQGRGRRGAHQRPGGENGVHNQEDRRDRRRPDGQRHRACRRARRHGRAAERLSADRINAGLATINGNLTRQVSRKLIAEEDRKAALARIAPADTLDKLGDCDLVIESATEKEDVKRKIFADLCPRLKPDAIVGTNTSSISITRLAASTDRPERFIGIHFMNPVPVMELVELIRGIATVRHRPSMRAGSSSRSSARRSRSPRTSRPSSSTASCCR